MTELYVYKQGIARLLQCLDRHDPLYNEVLNYRHELSERPEAGILKELDRLARCRIGVSFEALCRAEEPSADIDALLDEGCPDQVARLWKQASQY
ncbi:MAG: hypothetical protein JXA89_22155 [Anaerolineae bacterium]|nr:hypothetical protein [Anaerolineae bacterium]